MRANSNSSKKKKILQIGKLKLNFSIGKTFSAIYLLVETIPRKKTYAKRA